MSNFLSAFHDAVKKFRTLNDRDAGIFKALLVMPLYYAAYSEVRRSLIKLRTGRVSMWELLRVLTKR